MNQLNQKLRKDLFETFSLQKIAENKSFIKKQPPEGFCKKRGLKQFHKIHLKAPVLESLFNRVSGMRHATLLKKRLRRRCIYVNFVKFLRTSFLQNTSVFCLTVSFHKEVLYICWNLLLLEKWTKSQFCYFFVLTIHLNYISSMR